jgi:uncharacterized membrane protein
MKLNFTSKLVIILTIFAALFSFAKSDHCYNTNWATPDAYTHVCYSDLSALYGARNLIDHSWPYTSATNSVEYPPITGVVMWATSMLTPHSSHEYQYYFLINAFLLALLFIGTALFIAKINPKKWYLFSVTPAVIASLYINWDMWAVITAVASIYYFDRKRFGWSAIYLGVSIATKFFPIVLLAPMAIIFYRRRDFAGAIRYVITSLGLWILINIPFAISTPTGWWRFFKLNGERGADYGSIWYSLRILGWTIPSINIYTVLLFLIGMIVAAYFFLHSKEIPTLAQIAIIFVMIFTIVGKVYSPQYVLWLAPLGVIALQHQKDRSAFWIWQGSELLYHLAIWEYLAKFTGTHFGLPATWYAVVGLVRIAASAYFALRIAISTRAPAPQGDEFLLSAVES